MKKLARADIAAAAQRAFQLLATFSAILAAGSSALLLGGDWYGYSFPLTYLALIAWLLVAIACLALVGSVVAALAGSGLSGVRFRTVLLPLASLGAVAVLMIGTLAVSGPLGGLNFRVQLSQREAAARWALAESGRSDSVEPDHRVSLPAHWRGLSDSGEVAVINDNGQYGVLFFKPGWSRHGGVWLYTKHKGLAERVILDAVQLGPDWWEGGLS